MIRLMNWEIKFVSIKYEFIFVLTHFFTLPTGNCLIIYRKRFIRDYKIFINSYNTAKPFTGFACAKRIVEREKIYGRFFKSDVVQLEFIRKIFLMVFLVIIIFNNATTVAFIKSCLYRITHA